MIKYQYFILMSHNVSAHKLELLILFYGGQCNRTKIINLLQVISLVTPLLRLSDQQALETERENQVGCTTPAGNTSSSDAMLIHVMEKMGFTNTRLVGKHK